MQTRPNPIFVPRNFAVIALFGHVGGAALFALIGAAGGGAVAVWGAFGGAAFGGALGVFLGLVVSTTEDDSVDDADRPSLPPRLPWTAIGGGIALSVAVCVISFVANFRHSGFLAGSPCPLLSDGRGAHRATIETFLPAQYTCVYSDGALPLVDPPLLAALTVMALAGAVAIAWGQWRLRALPAGGIDPVVRILTGAVAVFLAADAVAGVVVLAGPGAS